MRTHQNRTIHGVLGKNRNCFVFCTTRQPEEEFKPNKTRSICDNLGFDHVSVMA